ncbi:MAG: LIC_13355 family lipoprotein [Leptonema sp. (in: Bacteria)]|nr:LIC_13355 family lipoprotein [Leptonema sp. (in: bacteria)]
MAESIGVGGSSPIGCLVSAWPFAPNAYLADIVTEAPGQNQYRYGDPLCATNGVYGSAGGSGSTDVYSLKSSPTSVYCVPNEKCIVLEWANSRVLDSTGVDFVVFENPFNRSESARFIEAVIVEVSEDGHNWCGWNPTYLGETNNTLPNFIADIYNPAKYERLAGIEPVLFNQSNWQYSATDIFDHSKAGGDHFDLSGANFGSSGNGCNVATKTQIQLNGFVYLRLTTANSRDGESFPLPPDSFDATADIDGVVAKQISNR